MEIGVHICYDRHFPEGPRAWGIEGAEIVFDPSAHSHGPGGYGDRACRAEEP